MAPTPARSAHCSDSLDGLDSTALQRSITGLAIITFPGAGFRASADGPGMIGASQLLCRDGANPCTVAHAESCVLAEVFANATNSHMTFATTEDVQVGGGATYTIGISALPGTTADADDHFSHSIVTFEP
jgi:hypothetical protein